MSITANGQWIQCDGPGCKATLRVPVGLRSTLSQERCVDTSQPTGWVFSLQSRKVMHYCPDCKAIYLDAVVNEGRDS